MRPGVRVRQALSGAVAELSGGSAPDSRQIDAELLLGYVLGQPRARLLARPGWTVPTPRVRQFRRLVSSRASGVPLAYLVGTKEFYGRTFVVRPSVLVPRPDSEVAVETAVAELRPGDTLVDIGTGSGCLGLSIALERPAAPVVLIDSSSRALAVARLNAARLGAGRTSFCQADLWPERWRHTPGGLHPERAVVVANLPYVTDADWHQRPALRHEPAGALRGGPDGLRLVRRLFTRLEQAGFRPKCLILEVDPRQVAIVRQLAWGPSEVRRDLAGRDRLVICYSSR